MLLERFICPKGSRASKQAWPSALCLWHVYDRSGACGLHWSERVIGCLEACAHLQHLCLSNFMCKYTGKTKIGFCLYPYCVYMEL